MKIASSNFIFLLMFFIPSCVPKTETESDALTDPFFGIEPTDTLQLVAPNIVSSNLSEYNGTFTPDGREFYYTVAFPGRSIISFMKLKPDNTWTSPAIARFSGEYSDVDPILSPDGNRLYFTSYRPTDDSSKKKPNIWYVDRFGDDWSSPQLISLTGGGEFYSSSTKQGIIYFNSWSTGDMFRAIRTDSSYTIEKLAATINSDKAEGDPFISPNEDYLIFKGYGQEVSFGAGDLYISFNLNGQWTKPENLGESINSSEDDICPMVTPDGKLLIFSSNRFIQEFKPAAGEFIQAYKQRFNSLDNGTYNIYSISTDFIEELRGKHLD